MDRYINLFLVFIPPKLCVCTVEVFEIYKNTDCISLSTTYVTIYVFTWILACVTTLYASFKAWVFICSRRTLQWIWTYTKHYINSTKVENQVFHDDARSAPRMQVYIVFIPINRYLYIINMHWNKSFCSKYTKM